MDVCDACGEKLNIKFRIDGRNLCSKCFTSPQAKVSKPILKKITEEDIKRNIQLFEEGKEFDISLRKIRNYMKCQGNLTDPFKIKKEYTLKCSVCHKVFNYPKCNMKYCSSICRRKIYNASYHKRFKNKMNTDWQFALKTRLMNILRDAIRYYNKTGKHRRHPNIGRYIDYPAIIKHLGPCPGDRSKWYIHHIKPLCDFDFSNTKEITKAFNPNNVKWNHFQVV